MATTERYYFPTAFQMLLDGHAQQLIELTGGDAFAVGDVLHIREQAGSERQEYLTGRQMRLRVTYKQRMPKALPTGVVVLDVVLIQA